MEYCNCDNPYALVPCRDFFSLSQRRKVAIICEIYTELQYLDFQEIVKYI